MSLPFFLAITSTIIYLIGFVPYIYHAFHGKVVPHPFSWTIWTILSGINTLAIIHEAGLSIELISPFTSTLSLLFGSIVGWMMIRKIRIGLFDYTCLALAVGIILIAYFFGVSRAIIPSILVDIIVLSPTLWKIWINPESEDVAGWLGAGVSRLLFLLSLGAGAFAFASIWWWYSISVNFLAAIFIIRRTIYMKNPLHKIQFFFREFALKKK